MQYPRSSANKYRTCRRILNEMSWDSYSGVWHSVMRSLFFNFINAKDPERCRSQAGFTRASEDGLLERAEVLRNIFQPVSEHRYEQEVFQNVYDVGIYISLSNSHWWELPPCSAAILSGSNKKLARHAVHFTKLQQYHGYCDCNRKTNQVRTWSSENTSRRYRRSSGCYSSTLLIERKRTSHDVSPKNDGRIKLE